MGYLLAALMGYCMGCSNLALYLSKWKNLDMKNKGTGNLGASNTVLLAGMKAGVLVAIHDIAKSALAVLFAGMLFPQLEYAGAVAGMAAVMGHIFPFYLRFDGGKGFASYFGVILMLNWKLALVIFITGIALTLITDYIVSATTLTIFSAPVWLGLRAGNWLLMAIFLVGTVVIAWKHRENYKRILNGTEVGVKGIVFKKKSKT